MSEHRKQRVTVGDLLDVQALDIPSIVEKSPRQIIDESDRQLDCDRHAVDDARLLSDAELADDRAEMAQPVEAETLDLTGPGVEETEPDLDLIRVGGLVHFHVGSGLHIGTVQRITTSGAGTLVEVEASGHTFGMPIDEVSACRTISCVKPAAKDG